VNWMRGDVVGTNLFNFQTSEFKLTKGPIFTDILLADEINRTPPKTQAALLQAMHERAVTIDGTTYPLGSDFMVIATQNPIEQQGTYPLPEAQLDRFLFKHIIDYPDRDEERAIVARHGHRSVMPELSSFGLEAVAGREDLAAIRQVITGLRLSEELIDYIVDIVRTTRARPGGAAGTRLRHSRRREGRRPAGAEAQGGPRARRRDRRAGRRRRGAPGARPDPGAALAALGQVTGAAP
jgi:MoxR-like ATPase